MSPHVTLLPAECSPESVAIVVVAAGSGTRLKAGMPKALAAVAGRSLVEHCLDVVVDPGLAGQVVVVTPPSDGHVAQLVAQRPEVAGVAVSCVPGGATRQESVAAGLAAVGDARFVLVHDVARAFAPASLFGRVVEQLRSRDDVDGVVPGLPAVDTYKIVDADGVVVDTPERSSLRAVQTPQGFVADTLRRVHRESVGRDASDDAGLLEQTGYRVVVVAGDERALKVTHPQDVVIAEGILAAGAAEEKGVGTVSEVRELGEGIPAGCLPMVGLGFDVHAFSDEDPSAPGALPLMLAGLEWPGERRLSGHSDGDAVAHAVCDAVFAASGLGDVGTQFGTDRPEFAGASGVTLVREAARLVGEAGFMVGNVSVQFVGNRPRFAKRREEANRVLSQALGAPVVVAATTSDSLGFEGAGEGISARAVAWVYPTPKR